MIQEYIEAALARAEYEIIKDKEPYYGKIPSLKGVWAAAKTLEECRHKLAEVVEGWIIIRLKKDLAIQPIDGHKIELPQEMQVK